LLFAIVTYRIQADRLGDLDHETKQVLDRTDAMSTNVTVSARLVNFDQKQTELTPGDCPGTRMGSAFTAGDGDGRWVCLEWPNL
jgi:translation elongation factor EF-1alpha